MHLVSGPVRVSRWMRAALAAAGLLAGLAGCVTTGAPPKSLYKKSTTDDDIKTASDQTAADRLSNTRMELAQAYLGRNISIAGGCFLLGHYARPRLQHRRRMHIALLIKELRHADFFTENSCYLCHNSSRCLSPRGPTTICALCRKP